MLHDIHWQAVDTVAVFFMIRPLFYYVTLGHVDDPNPKILFFLRPKPREANRPPDHWAVPASKALYGLSCGNVVW
jgi:hypothetical protein